MKKIVSEINRVFIVIVLAMFYLLVIGVTSVFLKISRLFVKKEKHTSYWKKGQGSGLKRDYFKSAY